MCITIKIGSSLIPLGSDNNKSQSNYCLPMPVVRVMMRQKVLYCVQTDKPVSVISLISLFSEPSKTSAGLATSPRCCLPLRQSVVMYPMAMAHRPPETIRSHGAAQARPTKLRNWHLYYSDSKCPGTFTPVIQPLRGSRKRYRRHSFVPSDVPARLHANWHIGTQVPRG